VINCSGAPGCTYTDIVGTVWWAYNLVICVFYVNALLAVRTLLSTVVCKT